MFCVSMRPNGLGHVPSGSLHHESGVSRYKPWFGMANQIVHPSDVGKLVAVSIQWVTAFEGCRGKSVQLFDGRHVAYAACGANYYLLVSCSPHQRP
jgi:hypothetical protein